MIHGLTSAKITCIHLHLLRNYLRQDRLPRDNLLQDISKDTEQPLDLQLESSDGLFSDYNGENRVFPNKVERGQRRRFMRSVTSRIFVAAQIFHDLGSLHVGYSPTPGSYRGRNTEPTALRLTYDKCGHTLLYVLNRELLIEKP